MEMMNKEEIDEILKELENHDILSASEDTYLLDYINKLQQENKQLKDNWNNLKEYLNEGTFYYKTGKGEYTTEMVSNRINGLDTLRKMQELEKSDSNE